MFAPYEFAVVVAIVAIVFLVTLDDIVAITNKYLDLQLLLVDLQFARLREALSPVWVRHFEPTLHLLTSTKIEPPSPTTTLTTAQPPDS